MALTREQLIAPCGLDCALCYRFQRRKDACSGCRGDISDKLKSCLNCKIKNCALIKNNTVEICSDCDQFPCEAIKNLDKRYRKSYRLSVLDDFKRIKTVGMARYLREQDKKWACTKCGETLCMHKDVCPSCGEPREYYDLDTGN